MTSNIKSWLRSIRSGLLTIIIPLLVALVLRVFFIEIYKIPSSSMEPSLLPGDIIMVSKMSYGARVLKPVRFFYGNRIEYIRTKGWSSVMKGDIFVFNWPRYNALSDSKLTIYGDCVVKRCYGLPGDSVLIKNEGIKNEGIKNERIKNERIKNEGIKNEGIKSERDWDRGIAQLQSGYTLFPNDSTLGWSLDNYGPLYVPAKGESMTLTAKNIKFYKDILRYENPGSCLKDSSLIKENGEVVTRYTFTHNYYFMLGDNFYGSQDSRYWGFVPDGNIIGKVVVILFSDDPNENGLSKIRWKRFLKLI